MNTLCNGGAIALGLELAAVWTPTPARSFVLTYQVDITNQPTWLRTAPGTLPPLISGQKDGKVGMFVTLQLKHKINHHNVNHRLTSCGQLVNFRS